MVGTFYIIWDVILVVLEFEIKNQRETVEFVVEKSRVGPIYLLPHELDVNRLKIETQNKIFGKKKHQGGPPESSRMTLYAFHSLPLESRFFEWKQVILLSQMDSA